MACGKFFHFVHYEHYDAGPPFTSRSLIQPLPVPHAARWVLRRIVGRVNPSNVEAAGFCENIIEWPIALETAQVGRGVGELEREVAGLRKDVAGARAATAELPNYSLQ